MTLDLRPLRFVLSAAVGLLTVSSAACAQGGATRTNPKDEPLPLEAPEERSAEKNPLADEMTEEVHEAIERGFTYLESQQNEDGSFGRGRYGRHVGINALCALAYMADGNLPG